MTSLAYGIDIPYEVQLEHHAATSTTIMAILALQRSPGQPATRHLLTPGVYMVSLAYNGAAAATLQHVGGGTTNSVSVPAGSAGAPRTSAPIKISVQGTTEYLQVAAPSTGGSARATISVIPASTFDEMEESAQGVSVLSEISDLKTTKADKSEVAYKSEVVDITARLDAKADKVDVQNDLGDTVSLLAGWTADVTGGRNHFSYTHLSNLENWNPSTYYISKEVIQLEPNAEYTFHAEEVTADTEGEWTVLNLMDGTDGILTYSANNPNRIRTIYNRKHEESPQYGLNVTFTAPSSGKVYFEFYAHGKRGEEAKPFWMTEKLVRAQIVRGREVPEWRPSPDDAVWDYLPNGESMSPLLPFNPATAIRVDNSVGTRVFVGDTMIHGDTGWRDISGDINSEFGGWAWVKRETHQVRVLAYLAPTESLVGKPRSTRRRAIALPVGFYSNGPLAYRAPGHGAQNGVLIPIDMGYATNMIDVTNSNSDLGNWSGSSFAINHAFDTDAPWPRTLPGLPV